MAENGFDLIGLIIAGGLSTYPLVLASIVAIAVVIDRLWALRGAERTIARVGGEVEQALQQGDGEKAAGIAQSAGGPASLVLGAVVQTRVRQSSEAEMTRVAESRQFEALEGLRQRLWLLATIGTSAPFVGLFGTVVGVMKSFHFMAQSGSGGFAVVAAGISEALVATALGLAVGIVSVAFYNYFEARLERVEAVLKIQAARLLETAAPAAMAA